MQEVIEQPHPTGEEKEFCRAKCVLCQSKDNHTMAIVGVVDLFGVFQFYVYCSKNRKKKPVRDIKGMKLAIVAIGDGKVTVEVTREDTLNP